MYDGGTASWAAQSAIKPK